MSERMHEQVSEGMRSDHTVGQQQAYFAAGCFWGVEAIFSEVDGVIETTVGYMNGDTDDPTYEEVCYKDTGMRKPLKSFMIQASSAMNLSVSFLITRSYDIKSARP